jgi:hypothetical protein
LFRQRVIVGKSLLIERKALDACWRLRPYFADVLAEDYWLGETFAQGMVFPCAATTTWIDTIKETSTVKKYFDRMTRWAKLRFNLVRDRYICWRSCLIRLPWFCFFYRYSKSYAFLLALIVISLRVALEYLVFFAINDGD